MTNRKIPIANVYYLLCYAWRHIEEADVVRLNELEGLQRIHDLLGKVLAEGTFRLIRRGIDRGYREVRRDLAGVRGKLMMSEMANRALRARGRAACEFEELSHDVLHNRILRSTLGSLLRLPDLNREVRSEVRSAWLKLDGVQEVRLSTKLFGQVQLDRNRQVERFLLDVCRLVYDQLLVDERSGDARFIEFTDAKMDKLFEDFAIEFYRRELDDFLVNQEGRRIRWNDAGTLDDQLSLIPRMEADVILESVGPTVGARRIVLDAKFYSEPLSKHYGTRKLRSENLYQLLAYLRNRELTKQPGPQHEGILLYPVVNESVRIDVILEGFSIRARSIDLSQDWPKVHADMLDVVA